MSKFRCAGDIIFQENKITPGQICNVQLKEFSETCNFLQYQRPLTPDKPYFFAQIRTLSPYSKITLGIAGPDIASDAHPGHWLNSVGYHSDTGQCYTSHQCAANTEGEKFGIGDVFGVLVTYFGNKKSTVIFLKNGNPVATRFLFESDHSRYLPTISLENGPIDLGLMWPEAAISIPSYSEKNMLHWLKPSAVSYDLKSNIFQFSGQGTITEELTVQSPHPLSADTQHFEVIIQQSSSEVPGPIICLATCSPLLPSPSCAICQDYIRFDLDIKNQNTLGHRIGWGVHYNPATRKRPDFNPRAEQLVYCYVTGDTEFVLGRVMMQPEGGFYPLCILQEGASKVTIDIETNKRPAHMVNFLDEMFEQEIVHAELLLQQDLHDREVRPSMLRKSADVEVSSMDGQYCRLRLPSHKPGIHVVQFTKPLTEDSNYFCLRIKQLNEDSGVGIGVAGKEFPLGKYPGKTRPSVGWTSKDGKLYKNTRIAGNLSGDIYKEGDIVGLEMEAFATEMSVALFTKNMHPVGTAYYTQSDRSEFLPTVALCSNGHDVEVEVCWPNMTRGAPIFSVVNLHHWCIPPGSEVDASTNTVRVKEHFGPLYLQAPYSLHKGYNHFEIRLTKAFDADTPPPVIMLSTASPLEPIPDSNLKVDFLHFCPTNSLLVREGDLVGWGLMYTDPSIHHDEEQLVICYLTVNRFISLVRVVSQPPGGFYPHIVLPPAVNDVTLDFSATIIKHHPITDRDVEILMKEAEDLLLTEKEIRLRGGDPVLELANLAFFRTLPSAEALKEKVDNSSPASTKSGRHSKVEDKRIAKNRKVNKMSTTINDSLMKTGKADGGLKDGTQMSSRSCVVL